MRKTIAIVLVALSSVAAGNAFAQIASIATQGPADFASGAGQADEAARRADPISHVQRPDRKRIKRHETCSRRWATLIVDGAVRSVILDCNDRPI